MSKVYIVSRSVYEYEDIFEDKDMAFSSREKAVAKAKELFDKDKEAQIKDLEDSLKYKKQELKRKEKEHEEKGYDKHLDSDDFKERYKRFIDANDTSTGIIFADKSTQDILTKEDWDAIKSKQSISHVEKRIATLEQALDRVKHKEFDGKCYKFFYEGLSKSCNIKELELM